MSKIKPNINLLLFYKLSNLTGSSETIILNNEQKEKIEFAQKQYLNGRYLSDYQAEKDIEECLI